MATNARREFCSHAPLEIIRQDALQGRWSEARRTCCSMGLSECFDLDLIWAVWAKDAEAVEEAVAKAERKAQRSGPRRAGADWRTAN